MKAPPRAVHPAFEAAPPVDDPAALPEAGEGAVPSRPDKYAMRGPREEPAAGPEPTPDTLFGDAIALGEVGTLGRGTGEGVGYGAGAGTIAEDSVTAALRERIDMAPDSATRLAAIVTLADHVYGRATETGDAEDVRRAFAVHRRYASALTSALGIAEYRSRLTALRAAVE